jgi:DNA processing protein
LGEGLGVNTLTLNPGDSQYPRALRALPKAPVLRVRGHFDFDRPAIALVGKREASAQALAFTEQLAHDLVRKGFSIVSGGAVGIDEAAHRAAIAAGGRTAALIGSGLGRVQAQHVELFRAIVEGGGAVISPFEDDTVARNHQFFHRNELVVLLSLATIVIECGFRSGARNTAHHARKHARPLGVVPHAPWTIGAGTGIELQLGAAPVLSVNDVLALVQGQLRSEQPASAKASQAGEKASRVRAPAGVQAAEAAQLWASLREAERRLVKALAPGPASLSLLAERLEQPPQALAASLLGLECRGVLRFADDAYTLLAAGAAAAAANAHGPG